MVASMIVVVPEVMHIVQQSVCVYDPEGRGNLVAFGFLYVIWVFCKHFSVSVNRSAVFSCLCIYLGINYYVVEMMFAHDIVIQDPQVFLYCMGGPKLSLLCLKQEIRHHCITI